MDVPTLIININIAIPTPTTNDSSFDERISPNWEIPMDDYLP